jgi:hypothetical protein
MPDESSQLEKPTQPAAQADTERKHRKLHTEEFKAKLEMTKAFCDTAKGYVQISSAGLALPLLFQQAMLGIQRTRISLRNLLALDPGFEKVDGRFVIPAKSSRSGRSKRTASGSALSIPTTPICPSHQQPKRRSNREALPIIGHPQEIQLVVGKPHGGLPATGRARPCSVCRVARA